jgi:hypothetical protein
VQGFGGGDWLAGVVAAEVDVELTIREAVPHLVRPAESEGRFAGSCRASDDTDRYQKRGAVLVGEDGVQAFQLGVAVDEAAYVPGKRPGGGSHGAGGPVCVLVEVDAAGDLAGLHDIAGRTGQLGVGAAGTVLVVVAGAVDGVTPGRGDAPAAGQSCG